MSITATIFLTLCHLVPWLLPKAAPIHLNPSKIVALLSSLATIPYMVLLCVGIKTKIAENLLYDRPELILEFSALYGLGLLLLYGAVAICSKVRFPALALGGFNNVWSVYVAVAAFVMIHLAATAEKLSAAGGFTNLITNIARRTEILADTGLIAQFALPAALMAMLYLVYAKGRFHSVPTILVIALGILLCFSLSIFGGRKPALFVVFFSTIGWSMYVSKIRIFSPTAILGGLTVFIFFIGMLYFRESVTADSFGFGDQLVLAAQNLSYIDNYLFITSYFDAHNFWHGATFGDLLIRFGLVNGGGVNPPIDDGVYMRTLYQGWTVYPPTDFDAMFKSSWPPDTYGNGYLNFGAIGVFIFFIIRGAVIGIGYALARSAGYSPAAYTIFLFLAFNFHLTNLRLVQTLFVFVCVGTMWALTLFLNRAKARQNRSISAA